MNTKILVPLGSGLFLGLLAFGLLFQKAGEIQKKSTSVSILVAKTYIYPGQTLTADLVEVKSFPGEYVSPSAIKDTKEVEGEIALAPISAGEQILSNKFGPLDGSLAWSLKPGQRAFTLEVNEASGVGNMIRPSNHVDVLAKINSGNRNVTSFVFQDLTVLATGQKVTTPTTKESSTVANSSDSLNTYNTITLAVTAEQAETLMYLEGQNLKLVLRANNDDELADLPPISDTEALAKIGHFHTNTAHSIEVIRGESR
jgi:pilus assembly protein CpaB